MQNAQTRKDGEASAVEDTDHSTSSLVIAIGVVVVTILVVLYPVLETFKAFVP
jgi:hypothetical protein